MTNTNQQQDGIEERAKDCPHCEVAKEIGWAADHVCTETATLTDERNRLREALLTLSAKIYEQGHEQYYEQELAKAKELTTNP